MRTTHIALNLVMTLILNTAAHSTDTSTPTPGLYQIDNETITTSGTGPSQMRNVISTRGATGEVTMYQHAIGLNQRSASSVKGDGPNRWCVQYGPPPWPRACAGGACSQPAAGVPRWRRVGENLWEVGFVLEGTSAMFSAAPSTPAAAVASAKSMMNSPLMARLPAAERAAFQAQLDALPTAKELRQQDAEMAASIEQEILREAGRLTPAETAAFRAQAAALRNRGSSAQAAPFDAMRMEVKERWTRISDRCPS